LSIDVDTLVRLYKSSVSIADIIRVFFIHDKLLRRHISGAYQPDWDLDAKVLRSLYQLQQQYSKASHVILDRHPHQMTAPDFNMAVFSVLPPQLPSDHRAGVMKASRYQSVSPLATVQTFF